MENHIFLMGKSSINVPFSIANCLFTGGYIFSFCFEVNPRMSSLNAPLQTKAHEKTGTGWHGRQGGTWKKFPLSPL
jgi:hypothetical protein